MVNGISLISLPYFFHDSVLFIGITKLFEQNTKFCLNSMFCIEFVFWPDASSFFLLFFQKIMLMLQSKIWSSIGAGTVPEEDSRLFVDDDIWSTQFVGISFTYMCLLSLILAYLFSCFQ